MNKTIQPKTNFKEVCTVISMAQEYPGYEGEIKWMIVSDLTESELQEMYPEEIAEYIPYIYMTKEQ